VARVYLHPLPGEKRALELARLIDRLYRNGRRMVVWVADEGRRQILDEYLWTFDRLAFIPHVGWMADTGSVDDPVVLLGEPANPNRADTLLIADELAEPEWMAGFDQIHDLVPQGPEGDERRVRWRELGFEVADG
jgi:DNA polymerase-3 subunit chi